MSRRSVSADLTALGGLHLLNRGRRELKGISARFSTLDFINHHAIELHFRSLFVRLHNALFLGILAESGQREEQGHTSWRRRRALQRSEHLRRRPGEHFNRAFTSGGQVFVEYC